MKKLLFILTLACGLFTTQAQNANLRKAVEDQDYKVINME